MMEAKASIEEAANSIASQWSSLVSFRNNSSDLSPTIILKYNDFRKMAKGFDLFVGNKQSIVHGYIMKQFGIEGDDHLHDFEYLCSKKIRQSIPVHFASNRTISGIIFMTHKYILNYSSAGVYDYFGDSLMKCYPSCGIPCGWDEQKCSLTMYHPKI